MPPLPPPANPQFPLAPGLVADVRRALWLEDFATLVVADVHLGHLWVERQRGALLPIVPDDTLDRLLALRDAYRPRRWVFLGDTVHATHHLEVVEAELYRLVAALEPGSELLFILGNHDRKLAEMLRHEGLTAACTDERRLGPHMLVHGDTHDWTSIEPLGSGGRVIHGHQHPAIHLGDGVTTTVKVPCFLVSPRRVVLPAFSRWAAGVPWDSQPPLSPLTPDDPPETAIALLGQRLLAIPLPLAPPPF